MSLQQFFKPFALVLKGLAFGIGFSFALWCIYYVTDWYEKHVTPSYSTDFSSTGKSDNLKESVIVSEVEEHTYPDKTYFTGTLKNTGSSAVSAPSIEVNLFSNGKFVDQYSTYMTGKIAAGQQRYFKVSCTCKDSLPAKHDSFKVHLIGDN